MCPPVRNRPKLDERQGGATMAWFVLQTRFGQIVVSGIMRALLAVFSRAFETIAIDWERDLNG